MFGIKELDLSDTNQQRGSTELELDLSAQISNVDRQTRFKPHQEQLKYFKTQSKIRKMLTGGFSLTQETIVIIEKTKENIRITLRNSNTKTAFQRFMANTWTTTWSLNSVFKRSGEDLVTTMASFRLKERTLSSTAICCTSAVILIHQPPLKSGIVLLLRLGSLTLIYRH